MFSKLFAESGLSLDRLRALVEVGAAGNIVRASGGDPVRQSQYSRQLKELEDFFRVRLAERHGKGLRLTRSGRELARISRFFLLGLASFQRSCLAERQAFRLGAGAAAIEHLLIPLLTAPAMDNASGLFALETVGAEDIERRLHDLTLDFAVVTAAELGHPLQVRTLGSWSLKMWVPRRLYGTERAVWQALDHGTIPLVVAQEMPAVAPALFGKCSPQLVCGTFAEARAAAAQGTLATWLPDFLEPPGGEQRFLRVEPPGQRRARFTYGLAWNPRLLRLNGAAVQVRDALLVGLIGGMKRARSELPANPRRAR